MTDDNFPKPGEIYLHGEEKIPFVVIRVISNDTPGYVRVEAVTLKYNCNGDVYGSFQSGGSYSYGWSEHDNMKNDKKIGEMDIIGWTRDPKEFSTYVKKWAQKSLEQVRRGSLGMSDFSEKNKAEINANMERIESIINSVAGVAAYKIR